MIEGERWRGRVALQLSRPASVTSRQSAIQTQIGHDQKYKHKNALRATVDERLVIQSWNLNPYIVAQQRNRKDPRNHPVLVRQLAGVLPLVRKSLRKFGLEKVDEQITKYFDFCTSGQHINEGRSYGFKSLSGFLEKLTTVTAVGGRGWWDEGEASTGVEDDPLAKRIALSFEKTFCENSGLLAQLDEKGWQHFSRAAVKIRRFIDRQKRRSVSLSESDMIQNLLECVDETFAMKGEPVYPGHLSSDSVWTLLLQLMSEKGLV